jgi:hypothetical protein
VYFENSRYFKPLRTPKDSSTFPVAVLVLPSLFDSVDLVKLVTPDAHSKTLPNFYSRDDIIAR